MFNSDMPNQHLLLSWTSYYLKLQPHGRQTAQYISWSQGHSTSLHISKPISQTFTPELLSVLNILMCFIILSVRLLKKVKFNSYIVSLYIWLLIYLQKHFYLLRSSILQVYLVLVWLKENCRKIQVCMKLLCKCVHWYYYTICLFYINLYCSDHFFLLYIYYSSYSINTRLLRHLS